MSEPTAQPDRIDRYRILAELGRGAMGRVYLAEDPRIGRRIALKVLVRQEALNEKKQKELLRRFLSEARAAGCLNHPGIVTVFDANSDPKSGAPYLVMEWVEGRTLSQILTEEGALAIPRALDLVSQVAAALDHAHRQSVVHRDIKPANLLVTPADAVKVTDFGIAKLKSQSLTMTGQMIGTPYYMAPEQITGDPVDGRADLFALGVVLYECLTGEVAFQGETLAHITHQILREDPRPAGFLNPDVPERLSHVLERALEKRPEDRFQTGEELQRELRAVAEELAGAKAPPPRRAKAAPAGKAPAKGDLNGSTVSLTPLGAGGYDSTCDTRPRAGWLRRLAGLAALLFVLPIFATLALETIQEQRPEWLADAPDWMSGTPAWVEGLPFVSEVTGWVNDAVDRLREIPDWFTGREESLGPPPAAVPSATPRSRAERVAKLGTESAEREETPPPPAFLGPVAPRDPCLPHELLTLEDLLTNPVAPRDYVTRPEIVPLQDPAPPEAGEAMASTAR